jgi:hypothetical protein
MVLAVWAFQSLHLPWHPWSQLPASVLLGLATYAATLVVVNRPLVGELLKIPAIVLHRN